jgi:uncharacterized protein
MCVNNKFIAVYIAAIILLALQGCATYTQRIQSVHNSLAQQNFEQANKEIDKTRLLKKDRNRLLYVLEKGKMLHLLQQYDSSNIYLNEADRLIENSHTSAKDVLVNGLLNPMLQAYKPEDFEGFMVHYYKALNYIYVGNTQEALVEARRITLTNKHQQDKIGTKQNRYSNDAFSLMLQGLIYEKGNDVNNAFIAYRNAADVYLNNNNTYYGTTIPNQLKKDVLRTAVAMGFIAEQQRYQKLFNQNYIADEKLSGGELILFWESGLAPAKTQQTLNFNVVGNNNGQFFFTDAQGQYNIPVDNSIATNGTALKLSEIQLFAIALPKYTATPLQLNAATISTNNTVYTFEKAQNISAMAIEILQDRFGKELATSLTRMALKKLTELAATPKRDPNRKYKSEEEKAKVEKQEDIQELVALGLKIFNRATEKADTRNWQSLPSAIFYTRVPLQIGLNNITVDIKGINGQVHQKTISVQGNGSMQFTSLYTIQ